MKLAFYILDQHSAEPLADSCIQEIEKMSDEQLVAKLKQEIENMSFEKYFALLKLIASIF